MKLSTAIPLASGLAVGYVLGAAAGRGRYQQIKRAVNDVYHNPKVQQTVFDLAERAKSKSHRLPQPAAEAADTAATRVQEALTEPGEGDDPSTSVTRYHR